MTAVHTEGALTALPYASYGDSAAVLLAGPPAAAGMESFEAHMHRLGPLPQLATDDLVAVAMAAHLDGRGGGGFPLARKLAATAGAATRAGASAPVVVVNGSESEPASRKDRSLLELRPHVVLDGAAAAAFALGAPVAYVQLHDDRAHWSVMSALEQRRRYVLADPEWRVVRGDTGYVSGEASAVVSSIEGTGGLPRFTVLPLAVNGVRGAPTLVQNAETMAHLGLLARRVSAGGSPASFLVTLAGAVARPGTVLEVTAGVTVGALLSEVGMLTSPPAAVLIGGYAGTWLAGRDAWSATLRPGSASDVPIGCGVLAVLPSGSCGLAATAALATWLAGESAGQCGPCRLGLPDLGDALTQLSGRHGRRRDLAAVRRLMPVVEGRGACRHPDGVVRMVRSALDVFSADVASHVAGRGCGGAPAPTTWPLPSRRRA
jgi:NADH:ubiquinone oxidoreductase subunit F (NADH-binding)